ncbi:jg24589 [Pararge aegeria aegeria]|uniref:Jg24589 protein n=1 Tax=Pararge aegeria aegeria TaxID=348720 RepID=A0A8S4QQX6_9NEOP|nr:jg24589 [Pararge aegeria aegeria]
MNELEPTQTHRLRQAPSRRAASRLAFELTDYRRFPWRVGLAWCDLACHNTGRGTPPLGVSLRDQIRNKEICIKTIVTKLGEPMDVGDRWNGEWLS